MNNMLTRAITGFFFISFIILAVIFGGWYLQVLFGLVAILSLNEFYSLFKNSTVKPNVSQGLIIGAIIYLLSLLSISQQLLNPFLNNEIGRAHV